MKGEPSISIIINNYNYGRFLGEAIDGALEQTRPAAEVIVVDDGSTDVSRAVIASYGDRVAPVLKPNGGQASALNAGLASSRGQAVIFLDADDRLFPTAVAAAARLLAVPGTSKVHWPLREIDQDGRDLGRIRPHPPLPAGDLREPSLRLGPDCYRTPPTSGNAFARRFLESVCPIPEDDFRICADAYLFGLAPLFGTIGAIEQPQGAYRVHGNNNYYKLSFMKKLENDLTLFDKRCRSMARHCKELGLDADPERWMELSWLHRLGCALGELEQAIPPGEDFILVDEDEWGTDEVVLGRHRIPFPGRDGRYWGRPADDAEAIAELERLRRAGAGFIAFGWPAFWWLDHYSGLRDRLDGAHRCVLRNDRLIVFDLRP